MADISNESQSVPVSIAHTEDTEEGRAEGTSGYGLWRDNMVLYSVRAGQRELGLVALVQGGERYENQSNILQRDLTLSPRDVNVISDLCLSRNFKLEPYQVI